MADRTLRVKIGIDTSGLKADAAEAARAFDGIGKSVTKSADDAEKSTRKVGDETAKSADKSGAAWAKVGPWMGAAVAGGAVLAGKAILDLGMTYEQNLNQLQAVTRSTNAEMQTIGDTAMALGNDMDLPAASASDAAQAMLELAKGGLSAEQAMSAAKGTLTLAAAAQISGAEAATIQSAALNTFGLSAENAGHVADVLANVANASSGEITDFAQGMAQAGLVAKAMGVDVDSTATVLGIFANQGLSGSDAGTSLKTMLVSLTSPSKEAAGALEELGVKAFDANGNFVGMRTVTEQLSEAQKTMTTEQFNAAASTAFGTDAVRAAVAMAGQGVAGYDAMATAVSHAGGAQEVAAAQTKGVTGALNNVKNGLENAALSIYQEYSPALESMLNSAASALPGVADFFMDVLGVAADFMGFINDLPGPVKVAAAALVAISVIKSPVSDAFDTVGKKISSFKQQVEAAAATAPTLAASVSPLRSILSQSGDGAQVLATGLEAAAEKATQSKAATDAAKESATPLGQVLSAAGEGAAVLGEALAGTAGEGSAAAEAAGEVTAASDPLSGALEGAGLSADALTEGLGASSEKAKEVKGSAEAGAGGLRKMGAAAKIAGAGLLTAFGGPVGLGITLVTTALSFFVGGSDEAAEAAEELKSHVDELTSTLDVNTGAITENTKASVSKKIGTDRLREIEQLGVSTADYTDAILGNVDAQTRVNSALHASAEAAVANDDSIKQLAEGYTEAGVSAKDLSDALLTGNYDSVNQQLLDYNSTLTDSSQSLVLFNDTTVEGASAVEHLLGVVDGQKRAFFDLGNETVAVQDAQGNWQVMNRATADSADAAAGALDGQAAGTTAVKGAAAEAVGPLADMKTEMDKVKDATSEADLKLQWFSMTMDRVSGLTPQLDAVLRAASATVRQAGEAYQGQAAAAAGVDTANRQVLESQLALTEAQNKAVGDGYSQAQKDLDVAAAADAVRDAQAGVLVATNNVTDAADAYADSQVESKDAMREAIAATYEDERGKGNLVGAYDAATAAGRRIRDEWIQGQVDAGMQREEAERLAVSIGLIPDEAATQYALKGGDESLTTMDKLKLKLAEINGSTATAYVKVIQTVQETMKAAANVIPDTLFGKSYAGGNVGASLAGIRGFAMGGSAGSTNIRGAAAPSNPSEDNLLAYDTLGRPLMLRSDEWVINGKVSGALGPDIMGNLNDGMYPRSMFEANSYSAPAMFDARGFTSAPAASQTINSTYTPNVQVFIGNEQLRGQIQVIVDGTPLPVSKLQAAQREAELV